MGNIHLHILGTKGEIKESHARHRRQSGILVDGKLLLDIGEKSYLKYHPKWILISHLHPDHAYFVRRGKKESPATEAEIFAPEAVKGVKCRIISRKRKIGPYTVTPIPTHHSKLVKSQAYLIEKGGKSILYTADLVWINKEYYPLFEHVDLIITEGSFIREGGMIRKDKETGALVGHNGIPNLVRLFAPHTKKILIVHFGSWFYKNPTSSRKKLLALGNKYHVDVRVGYDGQKIKI